MRWDLQHKDRILNGFSEILVSSGIAMLLFVVVFSNYQRIMLKNEIASSYTGMTELMHALELYSVDNPESYVFPPDPSLSQVGVVLSPIQEPTFAFLNFLTTPVAFLKKMPVDPFMTQAYGGNEDKSAGVIHWIYRAEELEPKNSPYRHIGWGIFSIGPSLRLPPAYTSIFKNVPYQTYSLESHYYQPTNGLRSPGILYMDSLGNSSKSVH